MNEHPHIEELEQLARRAGILSPDAMQRLAAHVAECAYCGDILAEIEEYFEAMREVSDERVRQESDRLVRSAQPPAAEVATRTHVLKLHRQESAAASPTAHGYALAAKSESPRAGYSPIATLYSDDGRTLLRILHEHEHATYFFQLMSEFLERVPHALLVAPGREPMMTDADGAFRIADTEIDIVQIASMSIYFPLDRVWTGPLSIRDLTGHDGVVIASDDSTIHLTDVAGTMQAHIRWHGAAETAPRYSGFVTERGRAVGTISDGRVLLPGALLPAGDRPVDGTFLLY